MAISKELATYSPTYYNELTGLLQLEKKNNPHYGYPELRNISKAFRAAEQAVIVKMENGPLHAGNHKHDKLTRYAPFYNNYFIKYFILPANAGTNADVDYVFLESVVRQNSGAYNNHFIKHLPQIDI